MLAYLFARPVFLIPRTLDAARPAGFSLRSFLRKSETLGPPVAETSANFSARGCVGITKRRRGLGGGNCGCRVVSRTFVSKGGRFGRAMAAVDSLGAWLTKLSAG